VIYEVFLRNFADLPEEAAIEQNRSVGVMESENGKGPDRNSLS